MAKPACLDAKFVVPAGVTVFVAATAEGEAEPPDDGAFEEQPAHTAPRAKGSKRWKSIKGGCGEGQLHHLYLITSSAFDTLRSAPSDGRLIIFPFTAIAVEPPPSKFIASTAPNFFIVAASSPKVRPVE